MQLSSRKLLWCILQAVGLFVCAVHVHQQKHKVLSSGADQPLQSLAQCLFLNGGVREVNMVEVEKALMFP